MPASEAPNVVRIKSYINCFVKIEGIKVVCVKSAPSNMRRSSARDLEKQNSQTNMTVRGFFFFHAKFVLSSVCSSETRCTRTFSINFICFVAMVTEEVAAILGQAVVFGLLALNEIATKRYIS